MQSDTRARLQRQTDPFLRDRLHDFDDLANRLLRVLMNKPHGLSGEELPRDAIIVARNMGAAELLDYDRERIRGLVLEEGGPTSHVTIVARALGIASVGRASNIVSLVENGDADHRRRRRRRGPSPAAGRRRIGLCREGALPRQAPGAVPAPPRPAGGDPRRPSRRRS